MKFKFLLPIAFIGNALLAQVGIGITTPDPTSVLDIDVSSLPNNGKKGFLPPRVTTEQRDFIATPAEGLIVYNLTTHCLNIHNGTEWTNLCDISNVNNYLTGGDVKYSYDPADHDGWYLLDGRSITTLSPEAQLIAQDLGFTSNIPDFRNRFVKTSTSPTTTAITGGNTSNMLTITRYNMPAVTLNAVTENAGAHTHTGTDYHNWIGGNGPEGRYGAAGTSGIKEGGEIEQTTQTTLPSPTHSHGTVMYSSGGSDTPINITPTYIALNTFVYLGN